MIREIFRSLPSNFAAVFGRRVLVFHAIAIATTYALVVSEFDWWFFQATRELYWYSLITTAGISGFFVPVLLPVSLYVASEWRKSPSLMLRGVAIAQSVILAWITSSLYKAVTGRIAPEFLIHTSTVNTSGEFHFGLLQNGIFWGWPSSHAAVAFAMAAVVWLLCKGNRSALVWRFAVLAYALFIALGAAIGFHWFSDVLAGAIIGSLIGYVVAKSFTSRQ